MISAKMLDAYRKRNYTLLDITFLREFSVSPYTGSATSTMRIGRQKPVQAARNKEIILYFVNRTCLHV